MAGLLWTVGQAIALGASIRLGNQRALVRNITPWFQHEIAPLGQSRTFYRANGRQNLCVRWQLKFASARALAIGAPMEDSWLRKRPRQRNLQDPAPQGSRRLVWLDLHRQLQDAKHKIGTLIEVNNLVDPAMLRDCAPSGNGQTAGLDSHLELLW